MNVYMWLKKNKVTLSELATKVGVHRTSMYRYYQGINSMPQWVAEKIEEVTNGEVSRGEAMWPNCFTVTCPKCSHCFSVDWKK